MNREGFALLAAVAIPALGISIVEFIAEDFPHRFPYTLVFWLLSAPFFVLFAVVCHRSIILGGDSLPNRLGLFWSARETAFLAWTIAIIVVSWVLSFVIGLVALLSPFGFWITFLAIVTLLSYFYVRLAMVLPATAVEDGTSFGRAWSLTSGNGFRIIFVIVLTVAPVVIAALMLLYLLAGNFLGILVAVVSRHAIPLVAICALSMSYRELIDFEESALPD